MSALWNCMVSMACSGKFLCDTLELGVCISLTGDLDVFVLATEEENVICHALIHH